ncbi:MAG: LacI family DNA-binding transcriptional regulator [Draconibacterium sp.]
MKKSSITDIAEMTGLSTTTVSRVLSGKAKQYRIGKKSQQKIKEAAEKLNYVPNHFAANLRSGKSETIALIVPSLNNPFFAGIASYINAEVRKLGYITIIADSDEDPEIERIAIQQLLARNIEALIIAPCSINNNQIKQLHDKGLPVICIDRYFEDLDIPFVSTDNYHGAFTATSHLINNGHKNIACIQGVKTSTSNKFRVKGFRDAMEKAHLKTHDIVGDDFTLQNGYLETKLLLQKKDKPTAIFALSNTIAMGTLKAIKEEGLNVPEDMSIITFDDHPYLDFLTTPLTCVAQPVDDISKIAIKFLLTKLKNEGEIKTSQVLLKPMMKLKESVKRI